MTLQEYLNQGDEPQRNQTVIIEKHEIQSNFHGKLIGPVTKKVEEWYGVRMQALDEAFPQHTGGFYYIVEKGTKQLWTVDGDGNPGGRSVFMLSENFGN